jgi:hypothetical protein
MDIFQASYHKQSMEITFHVFLNSAADVCSTCFTTENEAYDNHHSGVWVVLQAHLNMVAKG